MGRVFTFKAIFSASKRKTVEITEKKNCFPFGSSILMKEKKGKSICWTNKQYCSYY